MSAGRCDFGLAIVKGLVERNDGHAYFGSTLGFRDHAEEAERRGLIRVTPHGWVLTQVGLETYEKRRLGELPREGRAYTWDWSITGEAP